MSDTAKTIRMLPWHFRASPKYLNGFCDKVAELIPQVDGEYAVSLTWEPDGEILGGGSYGVRVGDEALCEGSLSMSDTELLLEDLEALPESERAAHILGLVS